MNTPAQRQARRGCRRRRATMRIFMRVDYRRRPRRAMHALDRCAIARWSCWRALVGVARPRGWASGSSTARRRRSRCTSAHRRRADRCRRCRRGRWPRTADAARRSSIARRALRGRWLAERTVFLDNRQMRRPARLLRRHAAAAGRRQRGAGAARLGAARLRRPHARCRRSPRRPARSRSPAASPRRRRGCSSSTPAQPGRSGRISTSTRSRARSALRCGRCRCCRPCRRRTTACARDWPRPALDVHKHYGYAFQWFALAALIAGLYVWFQLIRPRLRRVA